MRLRWQYQWAGASLQNIRLLVCEHCWDVPQPQLRAIVVPADPVPIPYALPEPFVSDETTYRTISTTPVYDPVTGLPIPGTTTLVTQNGQNFTTEPYGQPVGLDQNAVMPLYGNVKYGQPVPFLSVTANGSDIITVTCSKVHGLQTNGQISVEGLSAPTANGFYSIVVTTATAFTYQIYGVVSTGSLLTSTTNMITCIVGLPYGYVTIPLMPPGNLNPIVGGLSDAAGNPLLDADGNQLFGG